MTKIPPQNIDIKGFLDRASNIENELDTLKEDRKELNAEMKNAGVDSKAFNIALKQMRKPLDAELMIKTNTYLHEAKQLPLFALS